jgi:ABC-type bacteriocin/lantibiotic exporter with double-glycine peptidase domain
MKVFEIIKILSSKDKKLLIILILLSLPAASLESLGVAIFIPYVNILLGNENNFFFHYFIKKNYEGSSLIIISTFLLVMFFVIKNIYLIFFNYLNIKIFANLNKELTNVFYKKYLAISYSDFSSKTTPMIIREITDSIPNFINSLKALISIVTNLLILFFLFFILIFFEKNHLLYLLIFSTLCLTVYLISKKKLKKWGRIRYENSLRLYNNLLSAFLLFREIKILRKSSFFILRFNNFLNKVITSNLKKEFLTSSFRYIFEILAIIFISLIVIDYTQVNNVKNSIPIISVLAIAFARMIPVINSLINSMATIKNSSASLERIIKENKIYPEVINEYPKVKIDNFSFKNFKKLKINNLNFNYDDKKIFCDLNLDFKIGDKVLVFGDSGSGKTTFINILMGFLKPEKGNVLFDEKNIMDNLYEWRSLIGYVSQEAYIIDETIEKNITLEDDNSKITQSSLKYAIKSSGLNDLIDDRGLNWNVGERGKFLSGGQKKRIAIARAFYSKPKILILDEATSGLDRVSEERIVSDLFNTNQTKEMIIFFITHNLNLKKYFTRCLNLKNSSFEEDI